MKSAANPPFALPEGWVNSRARWLASRCSSFLSKKMLLLNFALIPSSVFKEPFHTRFPTANAAVKVLENLGLVAEQTGQKKNRSYSYHGYIALLTQ